VDGRVDAIARLALQRLDAPMRPSSGRTGPLPAELRIGALPLAQLSRLVYLQAGDPLVDQALAMLKAGRPIFLDRAAIEVALGFADYPPRLQEQFNRWFSRLSGYGIALTGDPASTADTPASPASLPMLPPAPIPPRSFASAVLPRAEEQIFAEILGDAVPEPHPCVKEPGVMCCGSGRCKTLGF